MPENHFLAHLNHIASLHGIQDIQQSVNWKVFFSKNSKSFSFASLFFPKIKHLQVQKVYAFCRITDDLVDRADGFTQSQLKNLLEEWKSLCKNAYQDGSSKISFLDEVLQDAAKNQVPLAYALELIRGMEMDTIKRDYKNMNELYQYCYRVASVVGLWLTELFGVHDELILKRAESMGHAMQITNILRDVGDDLRMGRIYLPKDLMELHQIDTKRLKQFEQGQPISDNYKDLVKKMMEIAENHYAFAKEGIPYLPSYFQKPVILALYIYRGIHQEIIKNDFNNFLLRAKTSVFTKVRLALSALKELKKLPKKPLSELALHDPPK